MESDHDLGSPLIPSQSNKSANLVGALFFVLGTTLFAVLPGSVHANEGATLNIGAALSALHFEYIETSATNQVLDAEFGGIAGGALRLGGRRGGWEVETALSYHRGRVTYDGHLTTGQPYLTRTDESITDAALRLGYWLELPYPVQPYLGYGYRRWDRDILPGTSLSGSAVSGLFESYRWRYLWLGARVLTRLEGGAQTVFDVGLLKPLHPRMLIDFKGVYAVSPTVYPEGKPGLRMSLTSSLPLSGGRMLAIVPYYEYWELGRSPTVNAGSVSVYEPASKTGNAGIDLRVDWSL